MWKTIYEFCRFSEVQYRQTILYQLKSLDRFLVNRLDTELPNYTFDQLD